MQVITREYRVFDYSELSEKSKKKARQWYIDDELRGEMLKEDYDCMLADDFKKSSLEVEFSLGYCQGDGLNIYGNVWLSEMLDKIDWSDFTPKEKRFIEWAVKWDDYSVKIPAGRHYCYCQVRRISFVEDLHYDLENCFMRDINETALEKFEEACFTYFEDLCKQWEKSGYKYLYEPDEAEVEDMCEANEWKFFENGEFFSL